MLHACCLNTRSTLQLWRAAYSTFLWATMRAHCTCSTLRWRHRVSLAAWCGWQRWVLYKGIWQNMESCKRAGVVGTGTCILRRTGRLVIEMLSCSSCGRQVDQKTGLGCILLDMDLGSAWNEQGHFEQILSLNIYLKVCLG